MVEIKVGMSKSVLKKSCESYIREQTKEKLYNTDKVEKATQGILELLELSFDFKEASKLINKSNLNQAEQELTSILDDLTRPQVIGCNLNSALKNEVKSGRTGLINK